MPRAEKSMEMRGLCHALNNPPSRPWAASSQAVQGKTTAKSLQDIDRAYLLFKP